MKVTHLAVALVLTGTVVAYMLPAAQRGAPIKEQTGVLRIKDDQKPREQTAVLNSRNDDRHFIRGDADGDKTLTMGDVILILNWLYVPGTPDLCCRDAADVDDEDLITMADPIYLLWYLYVPGGPPPPPPCCDYPDNCGPDPTPDDDFDCHWHPCIGTEQCTYIDSIFVPRVKVCNNNCTSDVYVEFTYFPPYPPDDTCIEPGQCAWSAEWKDIRTIEELMAGAITKEEYDLHDDTWTVSVTRLMGDIDSVRILLHYTDDTEDTVRLGEDDSVTSEYLKTVEYIRKTTEECSKKQAPVRSFGGSIRLEASVVDGRIVVPVYVNNSEPLSAFSYTISYDPTVLTFKFADNTDLTTEAFDFFSARPNEEFGSVSVGSVVDLKLKKSIAPGYHEVAHLIFELNSDEAGQTVLKFLDTELVDTKAKPLGAHTNSCAIKLPFTRPKAFLSQNYPNPVRDRTMIRYQLSKSACTTLKIYNLAGQVVKTLVDGVQDPACYSVSWNRKDDSGRKVSSGVYYYQLKANEYTQARKLVIVE